MMKALLRTLLALMVLGMAIPAAAQPTGPTGRAEPRGESIPPDVALQDLRDAYAKTTADEVSVRFRAPGGGERTDDLVVRLQASPAGIQRMLLELGPLRIYAVPGQLTAICTSAPGKYFQRDIPGVISPASLAGLLPPLPVPQTALAAGGKDGFRAPTPYTPDVAWLSALVDASARPKVVTLSGAGAASKLTVIANADNGRLLHLTAQIRGREGESTLDLAAKSVDPGEPASWEIHTEGRERVASLAELRPAPAPTTGQILPGQPVADLVFSKPDMSRWSLHTLLADAARQAPAGEPAPSAAIILFRGPALPDRATEIARDARTGLAVLRLVIHGHALPGEQPGSAHPIAAATAAAMVMELGEFSQDRWQEAGKAWGMLGRGRSPTAPRDLGADELLWASSGTQTIDRFAPGANAILVVIAPDRTLRPVVRFDGRYEDIAGLGGEVRRALGAPR